MPVALSQQLFPGPSSALESVTTRGLRGRLMPNGKVFFRDYNAMPSPNTYFPDVHVPGHFQAQPHKKVPRKAMITSRPKTASGLDNPHINKGLELGLTVSKVTTLNRGPSSTDIAAPARQFQISNYRSQSAVTFGHKREQRPSTATSGPRMRHLGPEKYNLQGKSVNGVRPRPSSGYIGEKLPDHRVKPYLGAATLRGNRFTDNLEVSPMSYEVSMTQVTTARRVPVDTGRVFERAERFPILPAPSFR